jgi:hypothetical protein
MLVTGPKEARIAIIVLYVKEYEVFYFDLNGLISGLNTTPVHITYPSQTYEFDYMVSLDGFNHRYFMVQQSNYLSFFDSDLKKIKNPEDSPQPQVPFMSLAYAKLPSLTYITSVELKQPTPELSQGTYTTLAISDYRSDLISILRLFANNDDPEKRLRHEWSKHIRLSFQINYNIQEVPGFRN